MIHAPGNEGTGGEVGFGMSPQMRQYSAPRGILSDRTTEAEIAAGRPPSYHVWFTDVKTGRQSALMGPNGLPLRLRFDPTPFQDDLRTQGEAQRQEILSGKPIDMQPEMP